MVNVLVIPDSHCKPGVGTERWKWLGKYVAEKQPDYIVNLGDHWDMESLCSYDRGTGDFVRRRLNDDFNSGRIALEKFENEISKASGYRPKKWISGGNHDEGRIKRLLEVEPMWEGVVGLDKLENIAKQYDWNWFNFGDKLELRNVYFSHFFVSGVMGRAISGENPAANMIKKQYSSCVAGHLHIFDYAERTHASGKKLIGITAGCFLEPGHIEKYAGVAQELWRNGVTMLYDVQDGQFDHEFIGVDRLRKMA